MVWTVHAKVLRHRGLTSALHCSDHTSAAPSFQGYPGALCPRTFACAALLPGPFSQICWLPPFLFSGLDGKVSFVVMPLLTNPDHCLFFS